MISGRRTFLTHAPSAERGRRQSRFRAVAGTFPEKEKGRGQADKVIQLCNHAHLTSGKNGADIKISHLGLSYLRSPLPVWQESDKSAAHEDRQKLWRTISTQCVFARAPFRAFFPPPFPAASHSSPSFLNRARAPPPDHEKGKGEHQQIFE